jgi:hypothetical protein
MPFFILAGSSKPHMYIDSDFMHFLEYGCHLLGMQHGHKCIVYLSVEILLVEETEVPGENKSLTNFIT